jgi:hypothetical protein
MKRFWVAVLCLITAWAIAAEATPRHPTQNAHAGGKLTFKPIASGELVDRGTKMAVTTYRASNGNVILVKHALCDDESSARQYYLTRLSESARVISQTQKKDSKGNIISERAYVMSTAASPGTSIPCVLLRRGKNFYELTSSSTSTIAEFENTIH